MAPQIKGLDGTFSLKALKTRAGKGNELARDGRYFLIRLDRDPQARELVLRFLRQTRKGRPRRIQEMVDWVSGIGSVESRAFNTEHERGRKFAYQCDSPLCMCRLFRDIYWHCPRCGNLTLANPQNPRELCPDCQTVIGSGDRG